MALDRITKSRGSEDLTKNAIFGQIELGLCFEVSQILFWGCVSENNSFSIEHYANYYDRCFSRILVKIVIKP